MSSKHTASDAPRQEGRPKSRAKGNGNGHDGSLEGLHAGPAKAPKSNLAGAKAFLARHPETAQLFRVNGDTHKLILQHQPPWAMGPREYPCEVTKADFLGCWEFLQLHGMQKVSDKATTGAMMLLGYARPFHPLRDHYAALKWDGKPRIDTWLSYYCGAEDGEWTRKVGRWFLISMAARALQPGCQVDHVLVLEGKQGIAKSSLCRILGGAFFSSSMPHLTGTTYKDAQQHLAGLNLIEIAEIDSFKAAGSTTLKSFISNPVDRYRAPYDASIISCPRTCVFMVTTNETHYLKDHTGARRYWPVFCRSIDLEAFAHDRDQLLAEAAYLYKQGERWWPDAEFQLNFADAQQAARLEEMPWHEPVAEYLRVTTQTWVTARDVFNGAIGVSDLYKFDGRAAQQITNIFKAEGWIRSHDTSKRAWRKRDALDLE